MVTVLNYFYKLMVITWIVLFLTYQLVLADSVKKINETEPLEAVETAHGQKIYIKKLNKHNRDGTYTVGYEADDGTFKYESKDVLGNIKGTIGYVDQQGEIVKKVSYTTSNKTALDPLARDQNDDIKTKSTSPRAITSQRYDLSPRYEQTSSPRYEQSTTPRRISSSSPANLAIVYPHATSSTRSPSVQTIPRKKIVLASSTTAATPTSSKPYAFYTRQATGDVSTSTSLSTISSASTSTTTPQPTQVIFTTSSPTSSSTSSVRPVTFEIEEQPTTVEKLPGMKEEGQIIRPGQFDSTSTRPASDSYYRKVLISRHPVTKEKEGLPTSKTSLEDVNEKDLVKKPPKSNTIRRQLSSEKDTVYDNVMGRIEDDSHDIYGSTSASETQRPLFTTTQDTKHIVLPRQYYRNAQQQFIYSRARSQKQGDDKPETLAEATTQSSVNSNEETDIQSQNVVQRPDYGNIDPKFRRVLRLRQRVPYNVDPQESNYYYYENPQPKNVGPHQFPAPQNPQPVPVHDGPAPSYNPAYADNYNAYRSIPATPPPPPGYTYVPVNELPMNYNQPNNQYAQQPPYNPAGYIPPNYNVVPSYPSNYNVAPQGYYGPTNYGNQEEPPLTIRDFQRLLQQLIYVQQKLQQLTHSFQQYNIPTRYQPVAGYSPAYPVAPARPDYRLAGVNKGLPPPPSNYIDANQYDRFVPQTPPKSRLPPDYLPPDVREMLLLRMLQLAINSEIAATDQMETVSTASSRPLIASTTRPTRKYAPSNRSVKIVGEDTESHGNARNKRDDPDEDMDMNE